MRWWRIGAAVGRADRAVAPRVERLRVVLVARLAEVHAPAPRERLAVAAVACRQHAVEQVDARAHGGEEVERRPDAHEVARPVGRHLGPELREAARHLLDRLTDREAAERQPVDLERRDLLEVAPPQREIGRALDDPEARLPLAARRGEAALGPERGAPHRRRDHPRVRARGRALVEQHRDVRAEQPLDPHRLLWGEPERRAVQVRAEGDPVVIDPVEVGEREDLKPAAVGEDRARPRHEPVQPAEPGHPLGAGAEPQVVGVREDQPGAGRRDLRMGEALDRGQRAHGHEHRRLHHRARRHEPTGPRVAVSRRLFEREALGRQAHRTSPPASEPSRKRSIASP